MPRQRYVVLKVTSSSDGPGALLYRVLLQSKAELGEKERHYVLYMSQHEERPAPYASGAELEIDARLVSEERT